MTKRSDDPLNLEKVELDWRFAAEEGHQHADFALFWVDVVDHTDEVGKRAIDHLDALALGEADLDLGRLLADLLEDLFDFLVLQRRRAGGRAHEASHSWRIAHNIPRVVVHGHLDHDVARVNLLLHGAALTVFDLDLFLSGNDHLKDLVLDAHGLDAVLEVGLDLVLVARVRVNHVPLAVLVGSAVAAVRHAHLIDHSEAPALADPEQQTEELLENVVDTAQKQTHGDREGNDDGRQVDRLALRRPGHLAQLRPYVSDEIERITPAASTASACQRHGRTRRSGAAGHVRAARTVARAQRRTPTGLLTIQPRARPVRATLRILRLRHRASFQGIRGAGGSRAEAPPPSPAGPSANDSITQGAFGCHVRVCRRRSVPRSQTPYCRL